MNKLKTGLLWLVLLMSAVGFGQADIWYVGNNISMDFSAGGAPVISTGIVGSGLDFTENSTSITDGTGKLLFAVAGDKIYKGDATAHATALPNKTWDVAQGTIVFPVPGSSTEYYLSIMRYAVGSGTITKPMATYRKITVDPTKGGLAGSIVSVGPEVNLAINLTESQAGVPKVNADFSVSDDYWLVTHDKCNNNFKVYAVTPTGIGSVSNQAVGPTLLCETTSPTQIDDIGVMKFNNCYTQMVYTIGGSVQLFNFDAKTGVLTFVNEVTSLAADQPYGVEFSNNGNYIYILTGQDTGHVGKLYSIPVTAGAAGLGVPVPLGATGGQQGGHLQMAPNGNIYYAIPNSFGNLGTGYIGEISNVDAGGTVNNTFYKAAAEDYSTTPIDGQSVMLDMPTFLKSLVSSIATLKIDGNSATTTTVCQGDNVSLSIDIEGTATPGVTWTATGANSNTQAGGTTFNMTMSNAGTTNIEVNVVDACGRSRTLNFDVEVEAIQNADANVSAPCPKVLTGTGSASGNYKWFTAQNGTLLGVGPSYTFNGMGGGTMWVEPAGTTVSTNVNDTRIVLGYNSSTGNTAFTTTKGIVTINEFKASLKMQYTAIDRDGKVTFTLKDGATTIGTPIEHIINCPSATCAASIITLKPTDWVVGAGNYTIETVLSGTLPLVSFFGVNPITPFIDATNGITISGGSLANFKTVMVEETTPVVCFNGKSITILPCCTQDPANGNNNNQERVQYVQGMP